MLAENLPSAALVVREHTDKQGNARPFYEAKFRYGGRQVMRRVGPAWLEYDGERWRKPKGRTPEGSFDERGATIRAAELVATYVKDATEVERVEAERRRRGLTFREVAHDYLEWLERDYGAKPATLKDYRLMLAEPGGGRANRAEAPKRGRIMEALGDLPAEKVTTADVKRMLPADASPRTYNKTRNLVSAIFNFGMSESAPGYKLQANPAAAVGMRREAAKLELEYFTPDEIESIARAFETGSHHFSERPAVGVDADLQAARDRLDAEAVRVSAYCGLRRGELLALRWRDVNWTAHTLQVRRALSAGQEVAPKSGKGRTVPLSDQATAALDRLSRRQDFTDRDELVFCNPVTGRALDGKRLYERYQRARNAAGLRALSWHALRHCFGSQLVASGVDLEQVRSALGHAQIRTTGRYLHARPAHEQAKVFTAAFATSGATEPPAARQDRVDVTS